MAKSTYVSSGAKIKVIGTGGAGCNAVSRMVREHLRGVEFIAMNTDAQALEVTESMLRVQLGEKTTRGLGAGGDHIIGHKAAEESRDAIAEVVAGADMVFVTAGMGGGTGTGSASIVAEMAKKAGALTIAVVTRPFAFEGAHRSRTAEDGIKALMERVDTLIIIPNDRLLDLCDQKTSVDGAFRTADEVLHHGVQAIAEVITVPGLINLDFADVRSIMKDAGPAWMSIGQGSGQNRAIEAARQALSSPLLDVSMQGAKGVLFNIAGNNLTLYEVNNAAEIIRQAVDPQANVIFGVVMDPNMDKDVRLTLIATGFQTREEMTGNAKDKELTRILKGMQDDELDIPSYLRQKQAYQSIRVSSGRKN
ncbi:MAG: cell division protein FtsZ [Chloroflexi bacterium RBG_13_51_52]|nr:MAG: cell division protein FtsZ [Chloroflexi bacterium RBG_13_51_52]